MKKAMTHEWPSGKLDGWISSPPQYVVGLDIGTGGTGLCVFERGKDGLYRYARSKTIYLSGRRSQATIVMAMSYLIIKELKKYKSLLICCEGYAFGAGFLNFMQPEIYGAVKVALSIANKPYWAFIAAKSAKSFVAGTGKATKSAMQKAVKEFGIAPDSPHSADAAAFCLTFFNRPQIFTDFFYRNLVDDTVLSEFDMELKRNK